MRLFLGFMLCLNLIYAEDAIKSAPLPSAEGTVVGATFSPDSTCIAIIRHIAGSKQRNTLQVVELGSGREVAQTNVLSEESASLGLKPHWISYSHDGKFLLLATKGSNIVLILDSKKLSESKRIALDSRLEKRNSLAGEDKRFFNGIVKLAVASNGDKFAALTHDELGNNAIVLGSITSGEILGKLYELGHRLAQTLGLAKPTPENPEDSYARRLKDCFNQKSAGPK
jgi:hypothetical protein